MDTLTSPPPVLDPRPPTEEPRLTLAGHLEELRRRLGVSFLALLVGVGISWTQVERIMTWLQRPAEPWLTSFAYFTPTEPFLAYLKVAALSGLILAMPVVLSQVWGFVRTGLTWRERYYGLAFIWWGSVLFVAGCLFAYYLLLPMSLRFLLGIGRDYLEPVISIERYLSFATTITFWCGLVFELPAVLFLLARVGIVTAEWLRQQRPYAILVLVILAALITPTTDPVSLLLMTLPLLVLYESAIFVSRWAIPRRPVS